MNATNLQSKPSIIDILLVEDNPADVRLLREALQENNSTNTLRVAEDGQHAFDILLEDSVNNTLPDLIVLDLNLPRKCGRELLREIKSDNRFSKIPVIVLTTSDSADDINSVYELRGNCYIQKPIDFDDFLSVVESLDRFWLRIVLLPPRGESIGLES
jgi:chemotaxis family two-component system response regulator Rcp1